MTSSGNEGTVMLAQSFIGLSKRHNESGFWLDTGIIQSDMSLKLDNLANAYPLGYYGVNADTLLFQDPLAQTADALVGISIQGTNVQHQHDLPRPSRLSPLAPNDRVLVGLTNSESLPIVICRVRLPVGPS